MNPARSFGPALISGAWEAHWVYWFAPILGALLAAYFWKILSSDCCVTRGSIEEVVYRALIEKSPV
jgi:Major intrinsic protein